MRIKPLPPLLLAVAFGLSLTSFAQQSVKTDPYMAELKTDLKTVQASNKSTTLDIVIMDSASMMPSEKLNIAAALSMPAMAGMKLEPPKVSPGDKPGHYNVQLMFPMQGDYQLELTVKPASGSSITLTFKITPGRSGETMKEMSSMKDAHAMPGMKDMTMKAAFGNWPASRDGSGTSWQPDSSPMFMKELSSTGGFDLSVMGTLQGGYVNDGGKRGDKGLFSNSMVMLMGRRETGGGTLGLHFMTSLDPVINGRRGVPNLFQNGFTVNGVNIADRKDPHNVFAEVAASYSHALSKDWSGFIYGGPVGEPALGNVMYFHRTSGVEIPEAPISHDWFDGTHISLGVATLGLVYQGKWKLEGSVFNGHEPSALYGIGTLGFNSASGRLSYNPSPDWSLSTSYGYLNSDVNKHRLTFSASYSHKFAGGDNLSATAYFGQNIVHGSTSSNAWLLEATYFHAKDGFFARFERVDKGELVDVPPGNYTVNKLLLGDVRNICSKAGLDYGLGAYAGVYSFPSSLTAFYGKSPLTFGVFVRIRPSKQ